MIYITIAIFVFLFAAVVSAKREMNWETPIEAKKVSFEYDKDGKA
jgi:hypothetical protein